MRFLVAGLFVGTVWAANFAVTHWGVVPVGFGLEAPAGVFFAGLGFLLRDWLQEVAGRLWVVGAIVAGAFLSLWLGASAEVPGGYVSIAVASACAFLLAELADFSVYTPLRERTVAGAVGVSQLVGAAVDSALFLWLAFGSLAFFWGQFVAKSYMTVPVLLAIVGWRARRRWATA